MMSTPIQITLPTIFPMQTVNAWLFTDPVPTLIDCGENTDAVWNALKAAFHDAGLQLSDLKRIIITHAHVDHMGMAGRLAEHTKAEVWVSEYAYDWALDKDAMWHNRARLMKNLIREHQTGSEDEQKFIGVLGTILDTPLDIWSDIPRESIRKFSASSALDLGGATWQCIHAPGHCINQTVFYDPVSRQMLGADLLLKITATPVIEPELADSTRRSKGLQQILESYDMIRNMDIATVLPGHYAPIHTPNELIDKQIQRIHQRKAECFELIKSGKHSLWELFTSLYSPNLSMPGLGMLVGYLDLLVGEGLVKAVPPNLSSGFIEYVLS